jgi:Mg2+ and Co2+ transporter CorA
MTDREKAIIMAHTGVVMLRGDKFRIFHNYVENILDKPIWTHELAQLVDEIREKSRNDFIKLCEESTRECDSCDDCISRQDAIAAMYQIEQDDIDLYGCKIPEGFDSTPAIVALKKLKSITPRPKMQEEKNEKREELIKCLKMLKKQAKENILFSDTLIEDVKLDSFNFVIDKAIKFLEAESEEK